MTAESPPPTFYRRRALPLQKFRENGHSKMYTKNQDADHMLGALANTVCYVCAITKTNREIKAHEHEL